MTNKSLGASDGSPVRRVTGCSYPPVDDERSRSRGVGGIPGEAMGKGRGVRRQSRHRRRAILAEASLAAEAAW
jgi:hypothetical protein